MAWKHESRGALSFRFVLVALALAAALVFASSGVASAATQNPIQVENSLPGTPGWDDFASVAQQDAISGFASKTSVNHSDSIDFYVTTTAASVKIDIFRTGWYGGVGARLVQTLGTFPGVHQPIPAPDPVTGVVNCENWTKTATLNVASNWVTGVYLAKLTASSGNESFIVFTVRDDGGTEPILFQSSVTTYQAYNAWGGVSLYTNNTNGSVYKYAHATKVTFDRPYDPLDGNGAGQFFAYEYPFIRWAESQGYNISYITDVDTATNNPITNHRVYLSVGHDEYWSHSMRDNVTNAISLGVNAAFFSANTAYWQIRFQANASGAPNRVEVGYKDTATFNAPPGPDPMWNVNDSIVTTRWRDDPVNLPENSFIGVMYQDQVQKDYAYVVQNSGNWIYAGTGFTDGTSIPGIVGYEYDKVWSNGFSPPNETVLSNSPVVGCCEGSGSSHSNSTVYTAPSGAQVFAAGTIQWSWGLDNYGGGNYVNAGIQKTTANILNAFSQGASTPAPAVTLSPSSLSFASQNVGSTSGAQTVTLTNSGNAVLTLNSISVTGTHAGDFSQSSNCPVSPVTLAVNASCTISVTFTPSGAGSSSASLSITDNASGSPQSVSLSGTGASPAPAVSFGPASLSFGPQDLGTTSGSRSTTLTNSGTVALAISSIGITGANASDFSQSSNCPVSPSTLASGASCTVSITFSPSAGGSRTASLSVGDNAAGSPQSVALSGAGNAPAVTVSPVSVSFAGQTMGTTSGTQTVTLTNSGSAALAISSIGITGTNASDFAQSSNCPVPPSPSTLAAGASCTVSVTFTPTATGSRSASLTIADNAPGSPQSLGLSGTGMPPAPAVRLTPSSLAFGSQQVGTTSTTQTSTVQNTGTAPLNISGISVGGSSPGDYAESDNCPVAPATLATGATCVISVSFSPVATGSRTASVAIADDAAGSPQSLPLTGTGTAPAVTLTPTSLAFGSQKVGSTSAAQTTTLKNSGTAPLAIAGLSVNGANAADYSQSSNCPQGPVTLAAGASCTISVTFTPSATGSRTANVSIADNASGSPQTVALNGSGSTSAIAFDATLGKSTQNVGSSSIKLSTSAPASAGSRVFVFVNWNNASRTLFSVSGGGLTWTVDTQAKDASYNHGAIASAYAPNGLPTGTAITATFSGSVTNGLIAAASFTGIAQSSPVDATGSNIQTGVAAWTGSVATTNPNDLVLGWSGIDKNTTNTPTAPNVKLYDFGDSNLYEWSTAEYRIETTTGTKTVNGTWASGSGSTANVTVVASYKGA